MKNLMRFASPLLVVLLMAAPARADDASDLAALKAQIKALSQKVDQLQSQEKKTDAAVKAEAQKPAAAPVPAEAVSTGTFPGSFIVPGTSTSMKIGGYVKLDAIEDMGSGYGASFAHFYAIPLNNTPQAQQSAQTTFGAQQSRLNFETRTPTSMGELRTFVEGDFYGASASNANTNGYGFELRHAYGSLGSTATGQILAGQTWSTFHDEGSRPESLDYVGPAGEIFVRQPQVRYSQDVGPVTVSGSAEAAWGNQGGTATQNGLTYTGAGTATGQGKLPDFVLRGDYKYTKDSYVSLRALGSQINVDRSIGANNYTASKYGYGLALSGKQMLEGKDAVQYSFVYADGTGRYLYDVNSQANFYNTTTNQLDMQEAMSTTLGFKHYWTDQLRSTLSGGAVRIVNDTSFTGTTANKYIASGNLNLIWQPLPAYQVGVEYMHGYRKIQNGEEGQLDRAEASFIFGF